MQSNGTNVLRVDGSDNWHVALNANGRSYSSTNLNRSANLAGRACPANVYVDDTNKAVTGRCVYYDWGMSNVRLDAPANDGTTDQTTAGSLRLGSWNTAAGGNGTLASWYEGNIQTCATKGMRLPLLYETTAADPGGPNKPADQTPTAWSTLTTGVPSVGSNPFWTASAHTSATNNTYWAWYGTTSVSNPATSPTYGSGSLTMYVRCVIP